jgi:NitT/TauT family transport system permease protein
MRTQMPIVLAQTLRAGRFIASNFWGLVALLVLWEVWVRWNDLNAIVMPYPVSVLEDVLHNPTLYLRNTLQTFGLALAGLLVGLVVGTLLAILTWSSKTLSGLLTPLALIFASVPVVALIPVLARLFGYDVKTVIVIVTIISFFPSFVFTAAGLRMLPPGSADFFAVAGASTWRRLTLLAIPAAIPNWMLALRLAAANSMLAAMVAEFLMGVSGLGNMFHAATNDLDMQRALGASLVAMAFSVALYAGTGVLSDLVRRYWE